MIRTIATIAATVMLIAGHLEYAHYPTTPFCTDTHGNQCAPHAGRG